MKKYLILFLMSCISFFANAQSEKKSIGIASYYHQKFHGRKTTSGEIFSNQKMTAAHNTLPLGTKIKVTNLSNGKTVQVTINDRLHAKNKRIVDLSFAAAKELDFIQQGTCKVSVEVMEMPKTSNQKEEKNVIRKVKKEIHKADKFSIDSTKNN